MGSRFHPPDLSELPFKDNLGARYLWSMPMGSA